MPDDELPRSQRRLLDALSRLGGITPEPWHNGAMLVAESAKGRGKPVRAIITKGLWDRSFHPEVTGLALSPTTSCNTNRVVLHACAVIMDSIARGRKKTCVTFEEYLLENARDVAAAKSLTWEAVEAARASWDPLDDGPTNDQLVERAAAYIRHVAASRRSLPGRRALLTATLSKPMSGGVVLTINEQATASAGPRFG